MKKKTWIYALTALMMSQGISLLGSSIVSLAVKWYVTLETDSGGMVALVAVTTYLPQALVMLYGGVLADRHPPKRIIMLSDSAIALSTLILSLMFFTGHGSIPWILVFNTLRSVGTGLQLPATKSILPLIVPERELMRANGISAGMWSLIMLVSPALGGLALNYMPLQWVFLIDVFTAAVGVAILGAITVPKPERVEPPVSAQEGLASGLRYIAGSKTLKSCLILYAVFSFLVMPASELTPLLASRNVCDEVWVLSVVETAFSVGALTVSAYMGVRELRMSHFKLIGLSAAVFGATMILLLPARGIVPFALLMLLMGVGSPLYYTPLITHIQENTDEAYMGRTFSYVDLLSSMASGLGMALVGPLADLSITLTFVVPGALLILLGLYAGKRMG